MSIAIRAVLLVAALIHLIPVVGVIGPRHLESLYGVALPDPHVVLLLRHRAVLFGIVGAVLGGAAFHAPLRSVALWVGICSTASFIVLALGADLAPPLRRVLHVDIGVLLLLLGALVASSRDR